MEKKTSIILGVLVLVVLIISFFASSGNGSGGKNDDNTSLNPNDIMANAQKESNSISSDERVKLSIIDVDKYLKFYNDDEGTLVFVGTDDCPYCAIAKPIIENFAYKYELTIYYLNTGILDSEAYEKLINSDEYFASGFGVPMLLYVGDGKIIDMVDGLYDTKHYLDFFKENNLVIE